MLRGVSNTDARALAQRCVTSVRAARIEHAGKMLKVSVSVGLASWNPGDTRETWLARADAALYRAKQEGRDRWAEASGSGSGSGSGTGTGTGTGTETPSGRRRLSCRSRPSLSSKWTRRAITAYRRVSSWVAACSPRSGA